MFIVRKKLPGAQRFAVMICRSIREGQKVRQKVVKYFGIVHSEKELKILNKVAQTELDKLQKVKESSVVSPSLETMQEEARILDGFHEIFGTFFDRLKFQENLSKLRYNQLRDVVVARIIEPVSKLHTSRFLQRSRLQKLSEDQIYRLMDNVIEKEIEFKTKIFNATTNVIKDQKIDVLLFDVTTLYFESQRPDGLREYGYSKDRKIGETQLVLALATTREGLPIGYTLFSGKTAETKTLLQCIDEWKKFVPIDKVIIVADRAMMSDSNLLAMEEANIRYVVAAKLKQLSKLLKNKILERKNEQIGALGNDPVRFQEYEHQGRRLIVSYSENRAIKDKNDREKLVCRLREKILAEGKAETRKLVTHRGYLKFLDNEQEGIVSLNEEKIAEEARWDGLHGIITNDKETSALDLMSRYRQLWVIEESFRLNKHTLAMRPIYHFKQKRVKAHILLCYLAFATIRHVQHHLKMHDPSFTIDRVREELACVESSILHDGNGHRYKVPSKLSEYAERIYRAAAVRRQVKVERMERTA
jgi:transposase